MIAGLIAIAILISYMGWIMFSFWLVGKFYYDKPYGGNDGVAALLTMTLILIPAVYLIGVSVFG